MGESIGQLLGNVEAVEFHEYSGKKMIIKIKVAINVNQPIQAGILIGNHKDGTFWIDFRYERLPQVCFTCGILGHGDKLCQNEPIIQEENAPLGPWIRSNQYGKRIMEEKDKKFFSNPSLSKTFGKHNYTIPESMVAEMEAMKLQEEGPSSSTPEQQKTQEAQFGEHRSMWHRTRRDTVYTAIAMDTHNNKEIVLSKRPRLEENWAMDATNQVAGPASQASQSP
jgi:hypothetical protein